MATIDIDKLTKAELTDLNHRVVERCSISDLNLSYEYDLLSDLNANGQLIGSTDESFGPVLSL